MLVAQWCDTRRNFDTRCSEFLAEVQGLHRDFQDGIRSLRTEFRAAAQRSRQEDRGDFADSHNDIQALTVRMARIQVSLVGYFTARGPLDSHDNA